MTGNDLLAAYEKNWTAVREQVKAACERVGRNSNEVRVIAVTKTVDESALEPLLAIGLREFGENRWQQARPKLEHPLGAEGVWHFIGHLQLNKAKYIAPRFQFVHSVDSVDLATALSHYRASQQTDPLRLLLQVNVSGEASKSGLHPDDVVKTTKQILDLPHVVLTGLMTMAPQTENMETTRPVFKGLRELRDEVSRTLGIPLPELSMGMSGDFTIAIEEGATMVRIGRRLLQTSENLA